MEMLPFDRQLCSEVSASAAGGSNRAMVFFPSWADCSPLSLCLYGLLPQRSTGAPCCYTASYSASCHIAPAAFQDTSQCRVNITASFSESFFISQTEAIHEAVTLCLPLPLRECGQTSACLGLGEPCLAGRLACGIFHVAVFQNPPCCSMCQDYCF